MPRSYKVAEIKRRVAVSRVPPQVRKVVEKLLDRVWGEEWVGDSRTLDVHMRWLREKLEAEPGKPCLLLTARNVGYRMVTAGELR